MGFFFLVTRTEDSGFRTVGSKLVLMAWVLSRLLEWLDRSWRLSRTAWCYVHMKVQYY